MSDRIDGPRRRKRTSSSSPNLALQRPGSLVMMRDPVAERALAAMLAGPEPLVVVPDLEQLGRHLASHPVIGACAFVLEEGELGVAEAVEAIRGLWASCPILLATKRRSRRLDGLAHYLRCDCAMGLDTPHALARAIAVHVERTTAKLERVRVRVASFAHSHDLTAREHDAALWTAYGLRRSAMAGHLGVTSSTCKDHFRNLFSKVGVGATSELMQAMWLHDETPRSE